MFFWPVATFGFLFGGQRVNLKFVCYCLLIIVVNTSQKLVRMPSDQKLYGRKRKKRRFHGNQYSNKGKKLCEVTSAEANACAVIYSSDNTEDEVDNNGGGSSLSSATPTCTEKKLFNLYNISSSDSSESEVENDPSDSEDEGEEDGDLISDVVLEGYRLVDIELLNKNISAQLCCKLCGHAVRLLEVSRKGLGSKFAFSCDNKRCDTQEAFSSCPLIQVGGLEVSSVNRRASFARPT